MKKLKFLLILAISTLMIYSCADNSDLTQENLSLEEHIELAKQGDGGIIEYLTLDELNAFYISKDMPTVTLKELEITEEEYEAAQKRINNEVASVRCQGFIAIYLLDTNNSGSFSSIDIWIASQALLGVLPYGPKFELFGFASLYWAPHQNFNGHFTTLDKLVAQQVLLGIQPCM